MNRLQGRAVSVIAEKIEVEVARVGEFPAAARRILPQIEFGRSIDYLFVGAASCRDDIVSGDYSAEAASATKVESHSHMNKDFFQKESALGMRSADVTIPVSADESVSGVLEVPQGFEAGRTAAVIVAHGAGNDMHNPLLVHFCAGLGLAGYLSLRFNFTYKEKGQKAPDPQQKLIRTWQAAFEFVKNHPEFGTPRIVAAGKSMGGRIASQMTADGLISSKALVFLGYPLHPPGKKDQLRDAHLYRISVPMLFFAGTRDTLCDIDLLQNVLNRLQAAWELETIEGGDHSFALPKSFKASEADVYERILQKTASWLNQTV